MRLITTHCLKLPVIRWEELTEMRCAVKITLLCWLLLSATSAKTQTKRIDSLKREIATASNITKKWDAIFAIWMEKNSYSSDTLYRYTLMAKEIADKLNDPDKKNWVRYNLNSCLLSKGLTDSAVKETDKLLARLKNTSDNKILYRKTILAKCNLLNRQNKCKESLEILFPFLNEVEKDGDYYTEAYVLNLISVAYHLQGHEKEFFEWATKGLTLPHINTDPRCREIYVNFFMNKGIAFQVMSDSLHTSWLDSASVYYSITVDLADKYEFLGILASGLSLKAGILSGQKKFKEAEELLKQDIEIKKQINDPYYTENELLQLCEFYQNTGQPDKAILVCKEALQIAAETGVNANLVNTYSNLSESYRLAGHKDSCIQTLKKLVDLKDSIFSANSAEALGELQTKYDVQKKENTIIQQKYDLGRKNYFIYGIAGLLAATVLFGYVFLRNRKKTQLLKLQQLESEQRQKTTVAVMRAEEDERKRIAGDLHDSVAQKMVVAKMNLESLGQKINTFGEHEQKIYSSISNLLDESAAEVRNLSHSMMPQAFVHSGLTDAVKDFLDKIDSRKLKINFGAEGNFGSIPEEKALMIYRIIQEAVQNVLKHAGATNLDIAMIAENNEADITIEDNGKGFDINAVSENSMGMKNIRSRTEYLGGKLEISSEPGRGTLMAFYIPLDSKI